MLPFSVQSPVNPFPCILSWHNAWGRGLCCWIRETNAGLLNFKTWNLGKNNVWRKNRPGNDQSQSCYHSHKIKLGGKSGKRSRGKNRGAGSQGGPRRRRSSSDPVWLCPRCRRETTDTPGETEAIPRESVAEPTPPHTALACRSRWGIHRPRVYRVFHPASCGDNIECLAGKMYPHGKDPKQPENSPHAHGVQG